VILVPACEVTLNLTEKVQQIIQSLMAILEVCTRYIRTKLWL